MGNRRVFLSLWGLLLFICSSSVFAGPKNWSDDYSRIFAYARELMIRPPFVEMMGEVFPEALEVSEESRLKYGSDIERLDVFSETQFVLLLIKNPDLWPKLDEYIDELRRSGGKDGQVNRRWKPVFEELHEKNDFLRDIRDLNDPLEPVRLSLKSGSPGYRNAKLYASHPRLYEDRSERVADNLIEVWKDFIRAAQKEIVINIFEFELEEIADLLVERHRQGIDVRVGIDDKVIESKPKTQIVFRKLKAAGVEVYAVDAVGFNHHKLAARDWSVSEKGAVLVSSGNLTDSCLNPKGDLAHLPRPPRDSIPNANSLITLDSNVFAELVNHELTKILDFALRGRSQLPLSGTYRLEGDGDEFMTIGFAPSGGLLNINNYMVAQTLRETRGPVYLAQFAFSSPTVEDALFDHMAREFEEGRFPGFQAINDRPFAMVFWSVLLRMSGLEVVESVSGKRYRPIQESRWRKLFGEESFDFFRHNIRIPHPWYGNRVCQGRDGINHAITAKLHHKSLVVGNRMVMGSGNFSASSKSQVEILISMQSEELAREKRAMIRWLIKGSPRSIYEESQLRNKWRSRLDVSKPAELIPAASDKSPLASCYRAIALTGENPDIRP